MSWWSSLPGADDFVDAENGEEQFVDVASHGYQPWVRVIIGNYTNPVYHIDDIERLIELLQEAVVWARRNA